MQQRLMQWTYGLAVTALAISLYSLLHNQGFASGEFCTIGEKLNCDIVNKGPYSQLLGIPVAFLGVMGYLFIAVAAWMSLRHPTDRSLKQFLLLATSVGLLFSLYLTGIEAFILRTWCLLCLTSQLLILIMFILCVSPFMVRRAK